MGAKALEKQPGLVLLMGCIICRWTIVETHTAMLFATLLPDETESALDIYHTFFEANVRKNVFLAVAKRKLSPSLYRKADDFHNDLRRVMGDRNKIAHGLWCWSENAPDCLCTVEQSFVSNAFLERLKVVRGDPFNIPAAKQFGLGAKITAYSDKDFSTMLERMEAFDRKGLDLVHAFTEHISPL